MGSRKIVVILGNGFDLDLGLKTSYKDFWESEFCPKGYPAPIIQHLNQRWDEDLDAVKWYDLENELLNYYKRRLQFANYPDVVPDYLLEYIRSFDAYDYFNKSYSNVDKKMEILVELGYAKYKGMRHLAYIPYQEDFKQSQSWRDRKALDLIKEGLNKYLQTVDPSSRKTDSVANTLLLLLKLSSVAGDEISIYSFNYTHVLFDGKELSGIPVHYMHGNCEMGRLIVGTRDDNGIDQSYDFLQKTMDDYYSPSDIVAALNTADEVIIFGHSLGENDRQYFAPFFIKQSSYENPARKGVTIFTRDMDSQREIKRALQRMTNGNASVLYSINQPKIIKTNCLEEDQGLLINLMLNLHANEKWAEQATGKLTGLLQK